MSDFKLSRIVDAHRGDVKGVAAYSVAIVTGSRDESVKLFKTDAATGELTELVQANQHQVVNSIAVYEPCDNVGVGGDGVKIFVGRKDGSIAVFDAANFGCVDPKVVLHEHKSNVCCLVVDSSRKVLLSGSWDGNAIVWPIDKIESGDFTALGLPCHSSVWALATVPDMPGHYLTGTADKLIRLWHDDKELATYKGHEDVVRCVVPLSSDRFLSCGNDSTIRLWNTLSRECLGKFESVSGNYIYSMCRLGPGGTVLASGTEGGTLELWDIGDAPDYKLAPLQQIRVPCASVWCLAALSDGDLAVASSDGRLYIFSPNPERMAPNDVMEVYDEHVAQAVSADMALKQREGAEPSDVVTIKVALDDGQPKYDLKYKKGTDPVEAAEKFITEHNLPMGHLGEIIEFIKANIPESRSVGAPRRQATQRVSFKGEEWDYLFDITTEDGRQLKLPYNNGESADYAAQRFCEANELPIQFLAKISMFLKTQLPGVSETAVYTDPFTGGGRYVPGQAAGSSGGGGGFSDPFTGGGRYVPGQGSGSATGATNGQAGGADPFTGGGRYVPGSSAEAVIPNACRPLDRRRPLGELLPIKEYNLFNLEQASTKAVQKLKECNDQITDDALKLSGAQLSALQTFLTTKIVSVKKDHISALETGLKWPVEHLTPVLDAFRIALLHVDCNKHFFDKKGSLDNNGDDENSMDFQDDCNGCQPKAKPDALKYLLNLIAGGGTPAPVQILVCRSLANACAHQWGRRALLDRMADTVNAIVPCLVASKAPLQIAVSSALANFALLLWKETEEVGSNELAVREDTLRMTLTALKTVDSFGAYNQSALIKLLQCIGTLMWGDTTLISIAKECDAMTVVTRIKDSCEDEGGKGVARDTVEMLYTASK